MSAFLALKVGTELRSCSHIPLFTCCTALLPDAVNETLPAFQVCKDTDACCAALLTSTLSNPRLPVRSLGALYTCCAALLPCALNTTLPACALLICCATLLSLILNTTLPACADFQIRCAAVLLGVATYPEHQQVGCEGVRKGGQHSTGNHLHNSKHTTEAAPGT